MRHFVSANFQILVLRLMLLFLNSVTTEFSELRVLCTRSLCLHCAKPSGCATLHKRFPGRFKLPEPLYDGTRRDLSQ